MAELKEYNGHYCESDYEYAFLEFLEREGWKYTFGSRIHRVKKSDVLISDDFERFLSKTNKDLSKDEIKTLFDTIRLIGSDSDFSTLHKVYNLLVNGIQFTPENGLPVMISLIDFGNAENNIFRAVNQFTVEYTNNGQKVNRRPDILLLESGEEEDLFSPEYFEKLSDVKMPATKLELLVKMLRKQIKEYGKVNQVAAKTFREMLEATIAEYHERRKHLTAEEAGETQETASESIIQIATEQALSILKQMHEDKESFRKIGLTFEEKAFYDILISLRDKYNFEYGTDKKENGVTVNDKCKLLAKKVKEIIDTKSFFADWLNNQNVRNQLKLDIKICLVKNGYPPQYSPEVFRKVMEQVENFEENVTYGMIQATESGGGNIYQIKKSSEMMRVAERTVPYGAKNKG